jgi:hypothetical protein
VRNIEDLPVNENFQSRLEQKLPAAKPNMRFQTLFSIFKTTARGAFMTLSSTAVACVGAVYVEQTAHRTLYRFFPHWYRDVDQALGLEPYLLEAVRTTKPEVAITPIEPVRSMSPNGEWFERNVTYSEMGSSSQRIFHIAITS